MSARRFYYKVASFVPDAGNLTLQDYLGAVYSARPKPAQRKQHIASATGEDSKARNVVGYRTEHRDMQCGVLQHYEEGAPVMVSFHSDDDDNFEMVQYPPPIQEDKKKKAEFVKSLLYFAVRGNHVVYIQSKGVTSEDLEVHLNWLVRKFGTNGSPQPAPKLFLEDNIPVGYRDASLSGVKSITLSSEPQVTAQLTTTTASEGGDVETSVAVPPSQAWALDDDPLIEGFLNLVRRKRPNTSKEELFKLEDAYKKGALRATVTLNFVSPKRGEASPLDSTAHILRHVEGVPYEMTLPHKEPLKSVDTKVTRSYNVTVKGELIVAKSAFDKMAEMLEALVKSKDIVPDPS